MNKTVLDPWIEGYLNYQSQVRRLAPCSISDMRCTFKRVVQTMAEIRPAVELSKVSLEDFLQWVNRQREQGYSVHSINKELSHVRGLLEYAWRNGHANINVLDGFSLRDAA